MPWYSLWSLATVAFIALVWGALALTPRWGFLHAAARVSLSAIPTAIIGAPGLTLWPLAVAAGLALYHHAWALLLPGVAGVAVMLVLLIVVAWNRG